MMRTIFSLFLFALFTTTIIGAPVTPHPGEKITLTVSTGGKTDLITTINLSTLGITTNYKLVDSSGKVSPAAVNVDPNLPALEEEVDNKEYEKSSEEDFDKSSKTIAEGTTTQSQSVFHRGGSKSLTVGNAVSQDDQVITTTSTSSPEISDNNEDNKENTQENLIVQQMSKSPSDHSESKSETDQTNSKTASGRNDISSTSSVNKSSDNSPESSYHKSQADKSEGSQNPSQTSNTKTVTSSNTDVTQTAKLIETIKNDNISLNNSETVSKSSNTVDSEHSGPNSQDKNLLKGTTEVSESPKNAEATINSNGKGDSPASTSIKSPDTTKVENGNQLPSKTGANYTSTRKSKDASVKASSVPPSGNDLQPRRHHRGEDLETSYHKSLTQSVSTDNNANTKSSESQAFPSTSSRGSSKIQKSRRNDIF